MSLDVYQHSHSDRTNLLVHLVFVPVFQAGIVTAALGHPIAGVLMMVASIAIQGRVHRREANQATFAGPFEPFEFVKRIMLEQLVTFPRFVLSGRFGAIMRGHGARRDRREARPARS